MKNKLNKLKSNPSNIIATTFLIVITLGTILFMLPVSTRNGEGLSLIKALFTATSSVCVTGLTLIDPAVTLTAFGQIVLLVLIEVGGISLITFATFFLFAFRKKSDFKSLRLAQEYTNLNSYSQVRPLVKTIVGTAVICQLFGAGLLCLRFVPLLGAKGIWVSIFTACSAYCNAGFDIFGTVQTQFGSLITYQTDTFVLLVVSAMIILGGLGFFVFYDILHYKKTKHLTLHSKVVILFSIILLLAGTICIFLYEYNNPDTIADMNIKNKMLSSFFQSVSARTAGFASVDVGAFKDITKIMMLLLMFVGAGSGSTGGGIKITTFAVLFMTVFSVIFNRDDTTIFHKRIDKSIISKSMTIAFMGVLWIFVITSILLADNPGISCIDALFESTSAFATVGISVGVTSTAHTLGLAALILTMFIGRLGPVCFVMSLNLRERNRGKFKVIPEGKIMVG